MVGRSSVPVSVIVTLALPMSASAAMLNSGWMCRRSVNEMSPRVMRKVRPARIDLPALAQRDAAIQAGLGDGADHAHVGAGGQAAVVVVDDDVFGGRDDEIELQPIEIRTLGRQRRPTGSGGLARQRRDRDRLGVGALHDADVAGQRWVPRIGPERDQRIELAAQAARHLQRHALRLDVQRAAAERQAVELERAVERERAAVGETAHAVEDGELAVEDDRTGQLRQQRPAARPPRSRRRRARCARRAAASTRCLRSAC